MADAAKSAAPPRMRVRGCATRSTPPASPDPIVAPARPPAPRNANTRFALPTSKRSPACSQNWSVTTLATSPV
jgi:hypothetical protein